MANTELAKNKGFEHYCILQKVTMFYQMFCHYQIVDTLEINCVECECYRESLKCGLWQIGKQYAVNGHPLKGNIFIGCHYLRFQFTYLHPLIGFAICIFYPVCAKTAHFQKYFRRKSYAQILKKKRSVQKKVSLKITSQKFPLNFLNFHNHFS